MADRQEVLGRIKQKLVDMAVDENDSLGLDITIVNFRLLAMHPEGAITVSNRRTSDNCYTHKLLHKGMLFRTITKSYQRYYF